MYDLLIQNGQIFDGRGNPPIQGNIAVLDGKIVAVGSVDGAARQSIDARGLAITPGFVDIHTHYDGQATWSDRLSPSSAHGITTVVTGNCGVGFAPCRPADRDALVKLMEGVEDIPGLVLTEGLTWDWESFPDFLDAIDRRPHDVDIATQLPHSALRVYVMGERAIRREAATADDNRKMAELATQAIEAGAFGFTTSRNLNHKTRAGEAVPSMGADEVELREIALGVKAAGRGVLEFSADFAFTGEDVAAEIALYRRLVEASGLPMSLAIAFMNERPDLGRKMMAELNDAYAAGLPIRLQVVGRPVGVLQGFNLSLHPFERCPSFLPLADLPWDDRIARLRDPGVKAAIAAEAADPANQTLISDQYSNLFLLGDPPNYEPAPEDSVAAIAARTGETPQSVLYDLVMTNNGHGLIFLPLTNFSDGHLDDFATVLKQDNILVGLGDAGAHVGIVCDASYSTFLLTHWGRDRQGERLPLPDLVKALTSDSAEAVGLRDRGVIAPGYKADLNVIDFDRLRLRAPHTQFDLPAGGRRLMQDAEGYVATIVSGEITYREGVATGALPGRLVRSGDVAVAPR